MTTLLFREDAYATSCDARVVAVNERGGIILDQTVFYATAGGQPGDKGTLTLNGQPIVIATTVYDEQKNVVHVPAEGQPVPTVGDTVTAELDWTHRQRALFSTAHTRNERRTLLIASDSPQIGLDTVREAFARLDRDDLVLGPTDDGGYYLVGMRSPAGSTETRPWDALAGVQMSTGTVLDEILARAARLGLRTSLLPPMFDVDDASDLERLIPLALRRDDLAAARAALERLGLMPTAAAAARPDEDVSQGIERAPVAVGGLR